MNGKDILALGFPQGPVIGEILSLVKSRAVAPEVLKDDLKRLQSAPQEFLGHPVYGGIALRLAGPEKYEFRSAMEADRLVKVWGCEGIDSATLDQMRTAMQLPITAGGAIMPDAHVGYGLPIGGVLATDGAVIPYAVGMDIACRMRLSVLPIPADRGKHPTLDKKQDKFCRIIEESTRFGIGVGYEREERKQHSVMDADWSITEITKALKDVAWQQLGTSGSGNHFCDLGEIEFEKNFVRDGVVVVPAGCYVAILTHSGSRGPGSKVASYYSSLAIEKRNLPQSYRQLSWLNMNEEGEEYWAAMELMGRFAAANHEIIHREVCTRLGLEPLTVVENHHNYAWREKPGGRYGDKEVIVHRKGATPAMPGVFGVIPGTMASPAYLVEGTAGPLDVKVDSLWSASHGAGRAMSRKKTKEKFHWSEVNGLLRERRVHLMSAGLDEVPGGYKKIEKVMEAQKELVDIKAVFYPRIVKMSGEDTSED